MKMFDQQAFDKMKKTSVLINVARGGIVDQSALVNALKSEQIFAAGLDVMTPEPLPKDDPLLSLPNCIVVPHLGTATIKSVENMFNICAHNVLAGLANGKPIYPYV
jgi:phosphoglycerate dehydrogenase-like enzyme